MATRGRPRKPPPSKPPESPCVDCGSTNVSYCTDEFGMLSQSWRCQDCHEQRIRRLIREDHRQAWGGKR